jgi:hypothetical protein
MKATFLVSIVLGFFVLSTFTNCDKVENPYPEQYAVDTTLYPGLWADYLSNEYPVFLQNTNTLRNALIEDYTGHKCNNCPNAAIVAHDIEVANPGRAFVASIHAAPSATGTSSFQSFDPTASSFYTDHTNPEGRQYGVEFQNGFNFFANPQGTVSRKIVDNKMFDLSGTWQSRTATILADTDLKVNLQSDVNFYTSTNGGFLHVEVEKLTSDPITMNAVGSVIEKSLIDWQVMPDNTYNETYEHESRHIGCIDDLAMGRSVFTQTSTSGEKELLDYSFKLPVGYAKEDLHFLIYVYDTETYEVLQVIKQEIQ